MWSLKKQLLSPHQLPIEGPWSVSVREDQVDGKVMIVRSNTGYREFRSVPGYEHQAGIAVPFRDPEPTGLPSPDEDAELGELEATIRQSLQEHAESLLVAIITADGVREFVFYTRAPEQLKHRFEQLRNRFTSHEIQLMIQLDKDWEIYAELARPHSN
jgi:hypothetical protein